MLNLKDPEHTNTRWNILLIMVLFASIMGLPSSGNASEAKTSPHLQRAKIFLAATDYRRAIEACQRHLEAYPSVEAYVYLTYVYHALEGYLEHLAKRDEWVKIGYVSISLATRGMFDLVDPPNIMPRMAREMIHEGVRQQSDVTASMANQLDKNRTDELWAQQTAWREANPDRWWAGVPEAWDW
ncbi:MAG: hypothetical protein D6690_02275 [Nitrospirae bacterium]|nr:MAG: hypothetical protein D6690_02275 [Nitrospirota bacterium]